MWCCTIFKMHYVHFVCFVNTDLRSLTLTCIIYTCYKCLACESKMVSILNLIVGSSVGCPLSCPLSCLLVGSLICMAKFPWAAHGQPTPLLIELPTFFMFGSSGLPTELPTELQTVSIYGSSGQPNLHGKIPMGSPLRCPRAAHGQRSGQLPCFFRMGYLNLSKIEKVPRDVRSESSEKLQVREKDWSQQVEHIMQTPNGTGPGVRRSKRPLSACYTCRKCSMETSHKSVKSRVRYKVRGLV